MLILYQANDFHRLLSRPSDEKKIRVYPRPIEHRSGGRVIRIPFELVVHGRMKSGTI